MKVLLLSRYGRIGASSRVRSLQFIPFLESRGWQVDVAPLFSNSYVEAFYQKRSRWVKLLQGYLVRLARLARIGAYDVIWIEKELFPFMPAWTERLLGVLNIPYVVDYDDAQFHRYDSHRSRLVRMCLGQKIDRVMAYSTVVIAGSPYLEERARQAGARRIERVPTVIDLERYSPAARAADRPMTVGWIGSPGTSRYLKGIEGALRSVAREFQMRIVLVGAEDGVLDGLPVEVWPWSEESEVRSIQSFDIGIMPLPDEPWERGKCGYKLIQYMACGLPVVASPVGVNDSIVSHGDNGLLADGESDWELALRRLLADPGERRRMGQRGRETVERWYTLQAQAPRLEAILREAAGIAVSSSV